MDDTQSLAATKRALRSRAKAVRADIPAEARMDAARSVAAVQTPLFNGVAGLVVAGFAAMAGEFDPSLLMARLGDEGAQLCLPVVAAPRRHLDFHVYVPGDALTPSSFGVPEPDISKALVEPDILLVPLLAFDRNGWRLGYGGGFYDRTLARLRALKPVIVIGLGFDAQEVDAVPVEDTDERLDWMLTPSGMRGFDRDGEQAARGGAGA